mgnify:CR=1 FL=1
MWERPRKCGDGSGNARYIPRGAWHDHTWHLRGELVLLLLKPELEKLAFQGSVVHRLTLDRLLLLLLLLPLRDLHHTLLQKLIHLELLSPSLHHHEGR